MLKRMVDFVAFTIIVLAMGGGNAVAATSRTTTAARVARASAVPEKTLTPRTTSARTTVARAVPANPVKATTAISNSRSDIKTVTARATARNTPKKVGVKARAAGNLSDVIETAFDKHGISRVKLVLDDNLYNNSSTLKKYVELSGGSSENKFLYLLNRSGKLPNLSGLFNHYSIKGVYTDVNGAGNGVYNVLSGTATATSFNGDKLYMLSNGSGSSPTGCPTFTSSTWGNVKNAVYVDNGYYDEKTCMKIIDINGSGMCILARDDSNFTDIFVKCDLAEGTVLTKHINLSFGPILPILDVEPNLAFFSSNSAIMTPNDGTMPSFNWLVTKANEDTSGVYKLQGGYLVSGEDYINYSPIYNINPASGKTQYYSNAGLATTTLEKNYTNEDDAELQFVWTFSGAKTSICANGVDDGHTKNPFLRYGTATVKQYLAATTNDDKVGQTPINIEPFSECLALFENNTNSGDKLCYFSNHALKDLQHFGGNGPTDGVHFSDGDKYWVQSDGIPGESIFALAPCNTTGYVNVKNMLTIDTVYSNLLNLNYGDNTVYAQPMNLTYTVYIPNVSNMPSLASFVRNIVVPSMTFCGISENQDGTGDYLYDANGNFNTSLTYSSFSDLPNYDPQTGPKAYMIWRSSATDCPSAQQSTESYAPPPITLRSVVKQQEGICSSYNSDLGATEYVDCSWVGVGGIPSSSDGTRRTMLVKLGGNVATIPGQSGQVGQFYVSFYTGETFDLQEIFKNIKSSNTTKSITGLFSAQEGGTKYYDEAGVATSKATDFANRTDTNTANVYIHWYTKETTNGTECPSVESSEILPYYSFTDEEGLLGFRYVNGRNSGSGEFDLSECGIIVEYESGFCRLLKWDGKEYSGVSFDGTDYKGDATKHYFLPIVDCDKEDSYLDAAVAMGHLNSARIWPGVDIGIEYGKQLPSIAPLIAMEKKYAPSVKLVGGFNSPYNSSIKYWDETGNEIKTVSNVKNEFNLATWTRRPEGQVEWDVSDVTINDCPDNPKDFCMLLKQAGLPGSCDYLDNMTTVRKVLIDGDKSGGSKVITTEDCAYLLKDDLGLCWIDISSHASRVSKLAIIDCAAGMDDEKFDEASNTDVGYTAGPRVWCSWYYGVQSGSHECSETSAISLTFVDGTLPSLENFVSNMSCISGRTGCAGKTFKGIWGSDDVQYYDATGKPVAENMPETSYGLPLNLFMKWE